MLYYKRENGYITRYTNNKVLAERNDYPYETSEEIVMQGDGKGYVLESEYVPYLPIEAQKKLDELKAVRDEKETEDIPTPFGLFDYDSKARERINAAIIALDVQGEGAKISWTLADNTEAIVTANDLRMVIALVAQRSNELHVKYRNYHNKVDEIVNNGGTAEEINAIVWED